MTTIPTEKKKRHRLTQGDCDAARLLMERKQTLQEIGKIIGVDSSTVGKIRLAGYDLQTYLAQRRAMNKKTREKKNRYRALVEETKEEFANAAKGKTAEEIVEEAKKRPRNYQEYLLQLTSKAASNADRKEVAGQLQMDLSEAEEQKPDDQSKQMKFQAAMMDKLLKKLDELIEAITRGRQ